MLGAPHGNGREGAHSIFIYANQYFVSIHAAFFACA